MNWDKIKRWLWLQKEGALVGMIWSALSIFAATGLATEYTSLMWYHKLLILPVYLSGFIPVNLGIFSFAITAGIGIILGMLFDSVYKPKE
jgi:hypothetical protein